MHTVATLGFIFVTLIIAWPILGVIAEWWRGRNR